jgi:membrane-associated phospholipid phosphatase
VTRARPAPSRRLASPWFLAGAVVATGLAHAVDPIAKRAWVVPSFEGSAVERVMKLPGELPLWLLLAGGLLALDWRRPPALPMRDRYTRAVTLALAALLGGALAEGLKMVVRRTRPEHAIDTLYAFRPLADEPWSSSGLGMPSSHAAVGFAAALILARTTPALVVPAAAAAVACAAARVMAGAHYVSDVVAALAVAWVAAAVVWALHLRTLPRAGGDAA